MLVDLNVLLIEDNEADSFYIQEILKDTSSIKIHVTDNLAEGIKLCHQEHYNVVLLDLFLIDSKLDDTFYNFQAAHPHIPVIVLTGLNDNELGLRTVKQGAQDYIVKQDINPHSLVRAIYFAYERCKPLNHNNDYSEQLLSNLNVESKEDEEALKLLREATAKIRMLGKEYSGDQSQPNN